MKKIIAKYFLLMLALLCLSSCGQKADENSLSGELYDTQRNETSDYGSREIDFKSLGIDHLQGMDFDGQNRELYLTSRNQSSVIVFDKDFKVIKSFQNAEMKFPSLLCKTDEFLFVLDDVTSQVFQFTASGDLERIIKLPSKDSDSYYLDMDVWKENIYLTLDTPSFADSKIFMVNIHSGEVRSLKDKFIGFIYQGGEDLLFANSMVAFQESDRAGFKGGENQIFKLNGKELEKQGDLIEGSFPGDFLFNEDRFYVYTSGWSSIDRYNSDFQYIDSIAIFNESDFEAILKGSADQLFFMMPNEQKLYEVYRK